MRMLELVERTQPLNLTEAASSTPRAILPGEQQFLTEIMAANMDPIPRYKKFNATNLQGGEK